MTIPVNILILDDSSVLVEIIEHEPALNHIVCITHIVDNKNDYNKYLENQEPDVILSDYDLPSLDSFEALSIARGYYAKVPFIFVSGNLCGDLEMEALRNGATDCIYRDCLKKLGLVVLRAIVENRNRKMLESLEGLAEDVTERSLVEERIRKINSEYELIFSSIVSVIIGVSCGDIITHWNPYAEELFGIAAGDIVGRVFSELGFDWSWERVYMAIADCVVTNEPVRLDDLSFNRRDGKIIILGLTINPLKRSTSDDIEGFIILGRDLTQRRLLESQLIQARKLEAVGQLASGVAHEINTPIQYIGDNLNFVRDSFLKLGVMKEVMDWCFGQIESASKTGNILGKYLGDESREEVNFLMSEIPAAIDEALEGVERVAKIVRSMKQFSHPSQEEKRPADINRAVGSTVIISRNEWKYVAEVEERYDPDLPPVLCFEAELNQVILNIIMNAVDAIKDAVEAGLIQKGLIGIATRRNDRWAEIEISDNGTGIPEDLQGRIFDPFFTTKDVGKGTGQGLAISYSIISQKHAGFLSFSSTPGIGTKFLIQLPLEDS
ncbi:MAG: hypothetical protein CVV44_02285 [Spirochaetae bacterium HGW-Spirochaetae-1]|jgi:PAS domain S-box-containing protein|nr:MAG: hypothetical protein CVV44_02285 [Spirochaetae bacterium HGW-Spirochaetae-1]